MNISKSEIILMVEVEFNLTIIFLIYLNRHYNYDSSATISYSKSLK